MPARGGSPQANRALFPDSYPCICSNEGRCWSAVHESASRARLGRPPVHYTVRRRCRAGASSILEKSGRARSLLGSIMDSVCDGRVRLHAAESPTHCTLGPLICSDHFVIQNLSSRKVTP